VDITLRWQPAELEIKVIDDGPGRPGSANGAGHGLIGMLERAALYGGSIRAEPATTGGFGVLARLPIEPGGQG
jgi:signal transduction histidine kinase